MMINQSLRRLLKSLLLSTLLVGVLVGNVHMMADIGWQPFGIFLIYVGLVFAILPAIPLLIIEFLGVHLPLYGRESFIMQNSWLWIYCVIFYTFIFYFIIPKLSTFKSFLFNRIKRNKNIYK